MSMEKVASKAGVSYSTVSRVINGNVRADSETSRKVMQAMKEIGYSPPPASHRRGPRPQRKANGTTGNIAVMLIGGTKGFTQSITATEVLHAIEIRLSEKGLNLILSTYVDFDQTPPVLTEDRVDGVILFATDEFPEDLVMEQLRSTPTVWVFSQDIEWGDQVRPNNDLIARLSADFFLERKHRNVVYLNLYHSRLAFRKRAILFMEYMRQGGVAVKLLTSCSTPDELEKDLEKLMDKWVSLSPRPTGLFVGNDHQLPQVYEALRRRGIEPGRDVTVLGCDNQESPLSMVTPRPASVDIGTEDIGRRAVDQLLWRMENPGEQDGSILLVRPSIVLPDPAPTPVPTPALPESPTVRTS